MKRLHGKVGIYDVYIDCEYYKTTITPIIEKEFKVSKSLISRRYFRHNDKLVELKKLGLVRDLIEYSIYKNDDLVAFGTMDELVDQLGYRRSTLTTYKYHKNYKNIYCDCIGFNEDEIGEVDIGDYEF